MVNYKLSPKATEDFARLYEYGINQFGLLQAQNYSNQLHETLNSLLKRPELWRKAFYIKSGLYTYRYHSHIIFFNNDETHIHIARILEAHRDFKRYL